MPEQSGSEILPSRTRRWPWSQKGDYARLRREYEVFCIELELLANRKKVTSSPWLIAAREQLRQTANFLGSERADIEGGWVCLNAARRAAVHALDKRELAVQAEILVAEAEKFTSWRATEIKKLLDGKSGLTAFSVIQAMALRDEYFGNQYHKIWMVGDQLALLLASFALGLILLIPLIVFYSSSHGYVPQPWGYQMVPAVFFFGLLGASFSAAGSLMNTNADGNVPERVANQFVTSARSLFGAGAGLAGYAFLQSRMLPIQVRDESGPGGAFAVAFLFGFAGEKLIANVLGTLGARK